MTKHLVIYDSQCEFCCFWVDWILRKDHQKQFYFAGFESKAAQPYKEKIQRSFGHSVVLVESYEKHPDLFLYGKAALRIWSRLHGEKSIVRYLERIPSWIINPIYRLGAFVRRWLPIKNPLDPKRHTGRFLD